ncbi:LAME_0E07360g1_1 [Lachancea meyersii CBS 8951]|uniref:LAME_0E07360g1_1 n=1 Tax=Lachancea meyersii CBS 8951 TaxID=1266667 RepID=A0A1G4JIB8_9SACH|nr:LAME_0E07360g1_1 [Lachancea meyersii CBS 8951]
MTEALKKRKLADNGADARKIARSKVLSPFRIVGNVSNGVPFAVGTLGSTFYIVTSVGKSFQIYDANNLHLLFVSEQETDASITCLATHFQFVFVGFGNKVGTYRRGRLEHLLEIPDSDVTVTNICVFGDFMCVSSDKNTVYVFKRNPQDKFATVFYTRLSISKLQGSDIVSVIHLPTYLNKIVVVTKSNLLVYNVKSGKLLYTSDELPYFITTAEAAPVLDIVALGCASGEIILFNVKKGRKVRSIKTPVNISSLSFRTDGAAHLAVGATNGDLIFYDLDRRSRIHVLRNVHREQFGGISRAIFLNGQPIVVTSGDDNQLKEYVFDPSLSQGDAEAVVQPPRFLRSRGGHSQPPTSILFADDQSHFLLSASSDCSLWGFSLRKDAQSQELSQRLHKKKDGGRIAGATLKGKFSEVLSMAIENARQGEWENVITAHKDEQFARTWNLATKRVGRWTLNTIDSGLAKSVAISSCGNFGFVGSSNGGIGVYNLQSGLPRKKYKLHKKTVTGIAVDGMNRKMVSCGLDGIVGFYDFSKSAYLGKLQLDAPITSMIYHRSSDLFAVALDDFSIVVIDAVTQKVVRQLWGHSNRISSFDFSPEGRWIVSASLDSSVRVWDLPTGTCIDGIRLDSVATNIKFSPNGDYVATTHVHGNGISIWTNRAQFKPLPARQIDEKDFAQISLFTSFGSSGTSILDGAFDEQASSEEQGDEFGQYESVNQINGDLITLSLGPRNKLKTLLNLDVMRQRSKPLEPPKKPEKAPFFLRLSGEKVGDDAIGRENENSADTAANARLEQEKEKMSSEAEDQIRKHKPGIGAFESNFTRLLREGHAAKNYTSFLDELVGLSPASVDMEIRSLNSFEPFEELTCFLEALTEGLSSNKNYELYEAFTSLLFKAHGDVIHGNNNNTELSAALECLGETHLQNKRLDAMVKYCSSVANFVSSA